MPVVFVYGALMRHPTIKKYGMRAEVRDYAARFTSPGIRFLEPRFLGLVPAPGEVAHGVVVELSYDAWKAISRHEVGYRLEAVNAIVDTAEFDAMAFVLRKADERPEGWPSRRYARLVLEGAEHFELPEPVLEYYREAVRRGSPWTTWLFGMNGPVRLLVPYLGPKGAIAVWLAGHVVILALLVLGVRALF